MCLIISSTVTTGLLLSLAVWLQGCGGGGKSQGTTTQTTTSTTTTPPPSCSSVFKACSDIDSGECHLPSEVTAVKYPKCNDGMKAALAGLNAAKDNESLREYVLGGLVSSLDLNTTCLQAMRFVHTSSNGDCPMPLPPPMPDLTSPFSSVNLLTLGDWGPTKAGPPQFCRCDQGQGCSDSMFQYLGSTCPKPGSPSWEWNENAQQRIADMLARKANDLSPPAVAVINVGDNFYYGGIPTPGNIADEFGSMSPDFAFNHTWADVYLRNKNDPNGRLRVPWLSIMGNHDYGGAGCLADWQAQLDYTALDPFGVWKMPFQYYKQRVYADGFYFDIFMNEVNVDDCCLTTDHGICHQLLCHGGKGDEGRCKARMRANKDANMAWLDDALNQSIIEGSRWQLVVGHYMEMSNVEDVTRLMVKHGAQLYIGGHKHVQEFLETGCPACNGIPQVVTGAGGGIGTQGPAGYGFFNLEVSRDAISVQLISDHTKQSWEIQHPMLHSTTTATKTTTTAAQNADVKILDALTVV